MDAVINAGITPIDVKYGSIHIVRLLTTYTKKNLIPDFTWREGSIRLNVDAIEKAVARKIQAEYLQMGNTSQTRSAIKQDVISVLTVFESNNILIKDEATNTPAFRAPVVSTDPLDSAKVNVDVQISP
jgi:hypothetical protein